MKKGLFAWAVLVMMAAAAVSPTAIALEKWDSWHLDQDLFAPGNEDRNYTMGLRFNWYGSKAADHPLSALKLLEVVDSGLGFTYPPEAILPTVSFGNSAFTPDDLRATSPVLDDRPYSSLLYTGTSLVVPDPDRFDSRARGSKIVFGVLGLKLSEWFQTRIHEVNRYVADSDTPYDPLGWDNQIADGGELTFLYQHTWMQRFRKMEYDAPPGWDAAGSCDLGIGYYSGASCGVAAKIWLRSTTDSARTPFWLMLDELNPQADAAQLYTMNRKYAESLPDKDSEFAATSAVHGGNLRIAEAYLVLGLRSRLVGYNELLQGGFRTSAHTLSTNEIERVVHEASLGVNLTFNRGNRVMVTCTSRSAEHKLAQRRSHLWCGLNYHLIPTR
jgi:hypothetical protein